MGPAIPADSVSAGSYQFIDGEIHWTHSIGSGEPDINPLLTLEENSGSVREMDGTTTVKYRIWEQEIALAKSSWSPANWPNRVREVTGYEVALSRVLATNFLQNLTREGLSRHTRSGAKAPPGRMGSSQRAMGSYQPSKRAAEPDKVWLEVEIATRNCDYLQVTPSLRTPQGVLVGIERSETLSKYRENVFRLQIDRAAAIDTLSFVLSESKGSDAEAVLDFSGPLSHSDSSWQIDSTE